MPDEPEVEVTTTAEALEALEVEATGGRTLQSAAEHGATGIDYVSVGGPTHSSPVVDIPLDLR